MLLAFLLVLIAGAAASPWILDAVARTVLARQGVTVGHAEAGYGGLTWHDIQWEGDLGRASVDEVRIAALTDYRRLLRSGGEPWLAARGVNISVGETDPPEEPVDLRALHETAISTMRVLERWLPPVQVEAIRVEPKPEWPAIRIERFDWVDHQLRVTGLDFRALVTEIATELSGAQVDSLEIARVADHLRLEAHHASGTLSASTSPEVTSGKLGLQIAAAWHGGRMDVSSEFGHVGVMPTRADLEGIFSSVPVEFSAVAAEWNPEGRIAVHFDGVSRRFSVDLEAAGVRRLSEADPVKWDAIVQAEGSAREVLLKRFEVALPGVNAHLSLPVRVDLETWAPTDAASVEWSIDLAEAGIEEAAGQAEGVLAFRPLPHREGADFALSGTVAKIVLGANDLPDLGMLEFRADGRAHGELVVLESFTVTGERLGELEGAFAWSRADGDAQRARVSGEIQTGLLAAWMPEAPVRFEEAVLRFAAQGERREDGWHHSGGFDPVRLRLWDEWSAIFDLEWVGRDAAIDRWAGRVERPEVALELAGSVQREATGWRLHLASLHERREQGEGWQLAAPISVEFSTEEETSVTLSPTTLRRGAGEIELEGRWAQWAVSLTVKAAQLADTDLEVWLDRDVPDFDLVALEAELATRPGEADGFDWIARSHLEAGWTSARGRRWSVAGDWNLDTEGVRFNRVGVLADGERWLKIEGSVPVAFQGSPDALFLMRADEERSLELEVTLEPIEFLPLPLEEIIPVGLRGIEANVRASGTLRSPLAQLLVHVREIEWPATNASGPRLFSDLTARIEVENERVHLNEFSLRLPEASTPSAFTGVIEGVRWGQWIETPSTERLLDLAGRLEVQRWPLAALGEFLPEMVEPKGSVTVSLTKDSGQWPSGEIGWQGIELRPIGTGLATREVNGRARLEERRLEDIQVTGTVGGRSLGLTGWVDFATLADPLFEMELAAERLDLIRQADLILRAHVDLRASRTTVASPALISGEVTLLDSVWLRDLRAFTQQSASGVGRRPPFFSVEAAPLADWRLDVRLSGEDFLQVRTPVMNGLVSADLELSGTLENPLLIGSAWVPSGAIIFPFARLPVNEVRGRITMDEPHTIQLSGSGEGITYGYSVQFQLAGTADEPSLTFSSVPSLSQDAILLMVATGAVPSSDSGINATARAGRLALYLGQDIFSDLLGSGGASRLEIRSGEGFSPFRRGGQVIEYKLNDDWSILGEYDDFGGYNVDLKRILIQR